MSLAAVLAAGLVAILGALSALHIGWAPGLGGALSGVVPTRAGRPLFVPGPPASLAVALALAAAAALCALRAGILPFEGPPWLARLGVWGVALAFAARAVGEFRYVGFFKRVRDTHFAERDTRFYSPLCVVIAGLASALALAAP